MTTSVGNNSVFRSFFEKQKLTGPNFIDWYRQLWKPSKATKGVQGKGKGKKVYANAEPSYAPKPKIPPPPKKDNPAKDAICHHCGEVGHWRRNCPIYLTELLKKKNLAQGASTSGNFTIELYSFPTTSWVYDTGYGTHICNTTQGLRGSKKLNPGALSLCMGNGQREGVEAIGNDHLCLPSRLVIILNNCHYAPSITRGIVSVSRLYEDGYINHFELNNAISVSKNNVVYFTTIPRDGLYEIEMSCSNTNDSSMYNVSNKRAKLNLDSYLLWHCRLGHISKKRIEKLQHDGLLNPTDIESLGKCVSCMFGKMARKPYSHQVERAKDLLGLIHTDVCSPFRIMLRQGANYFVTFTDDFSRYGTSSLLLMTSVSRLYENGYINRFELNNAISVSKNNVVYLTAIPRDGLYEIEMSCSNTNDSSMYNVSNKRAKLNLDSYLLWHCRLGHISKKHIEKLQHDGLLNPTDIESLGKCVSCMFSKMARKPYSHQVERVKDLLGLIHTDVCSLFRIMLRQGANYFVTFTDDFSRQEFLDHLKEHGIISHRIPPYTPQHNGVSERRNRTLLDMVRSMMSQTTLPNSFWDYALKSAARILNMVPTKKEEDTNPSLDTSLNHEEDDQEIDEPQSDINPIRRSTRTRRPTDRVCLYIDAEEHELGDHGKPANYKAALKDPESRKWLAAMNVEMQSMKDNDVWELVEPPPNAKTVGHKWLFKKKTDMDDIRAIRILIAITAFYDYEIWQMDVKTDFLNGHLSKEEYMTQPEGFVNPILSDHVTQAQVCAIMDLSKHLGNGISDFDDEIKKFGFTQNRDEPCVYQKASGSYVTFLILTIPMQEKLKLSKSDGASTPVEIRHMSNVPYASAVGSIMYAVRCTRPDVAFAQNITSRFQQNPGELYWTTVKNILNSGFLATLMLDITDADDLRSQTGYVFVLNGGAVDWKSTKQSIFVTSSTDAEYIAAFDASKEAVWIRKFIYGLNVVPTIEEPITMYCDNTEAIAIAKDHRVTKVNDIFDTKLTIFAKPLIWAMCGLETIDIDDKSRLALLQSFCIP
ncbi:retrotransposon protein, putative, ty1-copia subclass [Tanacetum coccineum]